MWEFNFSSELGFSTVFEDVLHFSYLKAAKLAMQCNVPLDDILGEKDGPMSILPSLMFSKTQSTLKIDDLIGKRLKLEDFDKSLVDLLRKHTGPVGDEKESFYIFGRRGRQRLHAILFHARLRA